MWIKLLNIDQRCNHDEDEPIYSQPVKPESKKINRDECNKILVTCIVKIYMK